MISPQSAKNVYILGVRCYNKISYNYDYFYFGRRQAEMSTLENTVSMMKTLPETDLLKIQSLTKKLCKRRESEAADEAVGKFLKPMSAEDIYRSLEVSRKQAAAGECSSAEEVFNELERRYKF